MAIETQADWNERFNCFGCCSMPTHPTPTIISRQKTASAAACGVKMVKPSSSYPTPPLADFKKWYKIKEEIDVQNQYDAAGNLMPTYPRTDNTTTTYSIDGSGNCQFSSVTTSDGFQFSGSYPITGRTYADGSFEVTYDSRGPFPSAGFEGYEQNNYLSGNTEAAEITEMNAAIALKFTAAAWPSPGGLTTSSRSHNTTLAAGSLYPGETLVSGVILRTVQFAFRIPTSHLGTFFRITYDILETPTVGDPFLFLEDQTIEWTGPGSGASTDPSWLTDYIDLDPPDEPGSRSVVNVRFISYTGTRFGVKPSVTGSSFP